MGSKEITQTKQNKKKRRTRLHRNRSTSQPSQATYESVEGGLDIGSRRSIQTIKEAPAKCPQPQLTRSCMYLLSYSNIHIFVILGILFLLIQFH